MYLPYQSKKFYNPNTLGLSFTFFHCLQGVVLIGHRRDLEFLLENLEEQIGLIVWKR